MEIVKDTRTIRLPKATTSVARTLRVANQSAKSQRWRKAVVIGEGPHGYHISNSKMTYYELLGFIEYAKLALAEEASE